MKSLHLIIVDHSKEIRKEVEILVESPNESLRKKAEELLTYFDENETKDGSFIRKYGGLADFARDFNKLLYIEANFEKANEDFHKYVI